VATEYGNRLFSVTRGETPVGWVETPPKSLSVWA